MSTETTSQRIYQDGAAVTLFSPNRGGNYKGVIERYLAGTDEYIVRLPSGRTFRTSALWLKARRNPS